MDKLVDHYKKKQIDSRNDKFKKPEHNPKRACSTSGRGSSSKKGDPKFFSVSDYEFYRCIIFL